MSTVHHFINSGTILLSMAAMLSLAATGVTIYSASDMDLTPSNSVNAPAQNNGHVIKLKDSGIWSEFLSDGREVTRSAFMIRSVDQSLKAAYLAREQYAKGYAGLLAKPSAEHNLLSADLTQPTSNTSMRNDLVNMYAAAGGGLDE